MNYLNPAVINTPAPTARRHKQTYEVGGTVGIAEWQHSYGGGEPNPYSYPPMPDLGGGQIHNLPGVNNWFDPSGFPRPIAAVEQQQVPFADNPMVQYGRVQDYVGVAAEGLVALKKPPASSSSARVSRKKSTASLTRARTPKSTKKSSGGYRTPAKPIASTTTTTTTTTTPGRTAAPDIGPDWTIDRVLRSDYKDNTRKGISKHGKYYKYWYSPWGHKLKTLIEVRLFQDALKRLEGGDHEGNEDIARDMVKLACENKVENGGLVLTDAIIEDAISKAEGGDLDKARGHVIIVKRNCSVSGCTRYRRSGGMCRMHHEEEKKKKSAATDVATISSRRSRSCPPGRPGTTFDEVSGDISPLSRPFLPPTDADHPPTDDDELVATTTDTNELGTDDTYSEQGGGGYFDSNESCDDAFPLPDDGSPLANDASSDEEIVLIDSDFLRLINKIPKLPKTDGVPLEDLTVSSTGSNFEVKATPPPSPTLTEVAALSDTEPSPPLKGSPLKDFSNASAEKLINEDKAYSDAINGPISEYCQQLDWVDEESLAWNRLDWGDIEGTPTPGKKTPTARSWSKMIFLKESANRLDTPAPSDTPAVKNLDGPRLRGGDPRRSTARGQESLGSLLGDVMDASTPPPPRRRRSTRIPVAL